VEVRLRMMEGVIEEVERVIGVVKTWGWREIRRDVGCRGIVVACGRWWQWDVAVMGVGEAI
jgi:hypothetical protein